MIWNRWRRDRPVQVPVVQASDVTTGVFPRVIHPGDPDAASDLAIQPQQITAGDGVAQLLGQQGHFISGHGLLNAHLQARIPTDMRQKLLQRLRSQHHRSRELSRLGAERRRERRWGPYTEGQAAVRVPHRGQVQRRGAGASLEWATLNCAQSRQATTNSGMRHPHAVLSFQQSDFDVQIQGASGGRGAVDLLHCFGWMDIISRICATSRGSTIDAIGQGRYRVCNRDSVCAEVAGLWQAYETLRRQEQKST